MKENFEIFLKKHPMAGNRTRDPWHCNPLSYLWTILGLLKIIERIAYLYQTFVRKRACQSTEKGPVNLKMKEYISRGSNTYKNPEKLCVTHFTCLEMKRSK